jgi:hypothetical protein
MVPKRGLMIMLANLAAWYAAGENNTSCCWLLLLLPLLQGLQVQDGHACVRHQQAVGLHGGL